MDNDKTLRLATTLNEGRYIIIYCQEQNDFCISYVANDLITKEKVLIKEFFMRNFCNRDNYGNVIFDKEDNVSSIYKNRFREKVKIIANLQSENIITIKDFFEENNSYYYVTNYIEGQDLCSYITKNKISENEAIEIVLCVAKVVQILHVKYQIPYLNIQPSIIWRQRADGHITIGNVELSHCYIDDVGPKVLNSLNKYYTPNEYPVHTTDGSFHPTLDIYSIGATLFTLLTGELPPRAIDHSVSPTIIINELKKKNISNRVTELVIRSMQPFWGKRISSIQDFIENIEKLGEEPKQIEQNHLKGVCRFEKVGPAGVLLYRETIIPAGMVAGSSSPRKKNITHIPQIKPSDSTHSFWSRLFGKKQDVYSSVFAPAEVNPESRMMVQVYLHLNEETEKVKALATESDKSAERRDYIPLQTKLKKGDKVDAVLNINGEKLLYNSSKSIVWQGSFCKCAFDYLVPSDLDVDELSCSVNLYVNGAIIGEMLFYTQIVESPAQLNANVIAKPVKKLFISYSHNDLKSAEKIAKLYEGMDVDVFFDKHRLKSGYIYSEEIFNFIRKADTFVLCWSENAAQSEYVEKERKAALELAYPNCRPREYAQISIKPYNIQPYATPPMDMIEHYHFEEL